MDFALGPSPIGRNAGKPAIKSDSPFFRAVPGRPIEM
jgi:hypothetical protein